MSAEVDHIEVAPRMWDASIAASRHQVKREQPPADPALKTPAEGAQPNNKLANRGEAAQCAPQTKQAKPSFYRQYKSIILPAIIVFVCIVVIYVLWKYFTVYRKKANDSKALTTEGARSAAVEGGKAGDGLLQDPISVVCSHDMAKYEYESDEEDSNQVDRKSDDDEPEKENSEVSENDHEVKKSPNQADQCGAAFAQQGFQSTFVAKHSDGAISIEAFNGESAVCDYSGHSDKFTAIGITSSCLRDVPDYKKIEDIIMESVDLSELADTNTEKNSNMELDDLILINGCANDEDKVGEEEEDDDNKEEVPMLERTHKSGRRKKRVSRV